MVFGSWTDHLQRAGLGLSVLDVEVVWVEEAVGSPNL